MPSRSCWYIAALAVLALGLLVPGDAWHVLYLTIIGLFWEAPEKTNMLKDIRGILEHQKLEGKNCLVTGSNIGLGKALGVHLTTAGCHVILACRSVSFPAELTQDVLDQAKKSLTEQGLPTDKLVRPSFLQLDLSDLDVVDRSIAEAQSRFGKLDVVVLNAAVVPSSSLRSKQGFELAFGVNYLGHTYFISSLQNRSMLVPRARVVFVLSEAHRMSVPLKDPSYPGHPIGTVFNYSVAAAMTQYGHTKICLGTFAQRMARVHKDDLQVLFYDPGPVATGIGRNAPDMLKPFVKVLMWFFKSPEECSLPLLFLSAEHGIPTGQYYTLWNPAQLREDTLEEDTQEILWANTTRLFKSRKPPTN